MKTTERLMTLERWADPSVRAQMAKNGFVDTFKLGQNSKTQPNDNSGKRAQQEAGQKCR